MLVALINIYAHGGIGEGEGVHVGSQFHMKPKPPLSDIRTANPL